MSTLSVDKIEPVGSTLTLGESGDTVTIPVGGTFTNNGTATGFAAGSTHASQWRLTSDFTGSASPIATNIVEVSSPVGFGVLGSSMTQTSGIFTFPATGYWYIEFYAAFGASTDTTSRGKAYISTTINDATYATASNGWGGMYYQDSTAACSYIMDVTDVTQCKVKFGIDQAVGGDTTRGDTSANETFFTFNRLADT